jgi:hypothetical protein
MLSTSGGPGEDTLNVLVIMGGYTSYGRVKFTSVPTVLAGGDGL